MKQTHLRPVIAAKSTLLRLVFPSLVVAVALHQGAGLKSVTVGNCVPMHVC